MHKRLLYGAGLATAWYYVGTHNIDSVKSKCFSAGKSVSQKFKSYPAWDRIFEPVLIRQFSIVFSAGHSFILGMASDNPKDQHIEKEIVQMDKSIDQVVHQKD